MQLAHLASDAAFQGRHRLRCCETALVFPSTDLGSICTFRFEVDALEQLLLLVGGRGTRVVVVTTLLANGVVLKLLQEHRGGECGFVPDDILIP